MSDLPSHPIRLADRQARKHTTIELTPDAPARAAIAQALGILGVRKLRLTGRLEPMGKHDWRFEGELGATVVQACVSTLEPVTTRIDEPVVRVYSAQFDLPDAAEVEMPEDDSTDPLPEVLDLAEVMIEALALALPPYPRKDGADPTEAAFTEPGKQPMTDADARPFSGLAGLRDALQNKDKDAD